MANFDKSAEMASQLIRSFLKERMEEKKITQEELSNLTGVSVRTLQRNLSGETEMAFSSFLKICGALEIRPYLVPAEVDGEMPNRIFFN